MNNDSKKKKWIISKTVNTYTSNHIKYKIITDTTQRKNKHIIKIDKLKPIISTRSIITRQTPIYDCNRGFMLAESYYDDEKNPTINPIGWWASEKYDGVRAIWNGIGLYSRNLTQIIAPKWFISQLPKNFSMDGELYIKRNFFNETSGYVRKKDPIDYEWENIKFMVFDVPHLSSVAFEDRMDRLDKILKELPNSTIIHKVPQFRIESLEQLMQIYQDYTDNGAEGLMLHKPRSPYLPYRCNLVLKLKIHSDEEAYVTGWQEGSNKNRGKLGALLIKWKQPELIAKKYKMSILPIIEFKVGSGFKDVDRCPISEAISKYPLGTIITIAFNGLQVSGKPRHPTFKGIKWDTMRED